MRCLRVACAVVVLICSAGADDKSALLDRVHRADDDSALDVSGVKPWHLKVAIQMFDDKGEPTDEHGIVDEWWGGTDRWRIVSSMPSYAVTIVHTAAGTLRPRDAGSAPMMLQLLLNQIVHPMPQHEEVDTAVPTLKKQNFGKVALECIMLGQPMKGAEPAPLGLFPTYCFDPGKDSLRVAYNFGSEFIARNGIRQYDSRTVAGDITISESGVHAASAKVLTLESIAAESVDLTPDPAVSNSGAPVAASDKPARIGGGVMAGTILQKTQPLYPESARKNHISGSVVMRAIIGRDGHIHSLRFISLPDASLGIAAVRAVRNWTYKPYLLNGMPTEVDTTITVNFNFGP